MGHDEDSPSSIIYLIEWKVTLNNRILAKNTEQDLVLKPGAYWQRIKEKADHVVQRKITRKQRVRADDTTVVVSVNDRQHHDLTKHFEDTDVSRYVLVHRHYCMYTARKPFSQEDIAQ